MKILPTQITYLFAFACLPLLAEASITRYVEGGLMYKIISGEYDVFEYQLDSIIIIGSEQYLMHFGSTTRVYNGRVDAKIEVLYQCEGSCKEQHHEIGTSYLVIAKKQKYRYLIYGYNIRKDWLASYKLGDNKGKSIEAAVKRYYSMRKSGHTGHIDISYGDRSRVVGQLVNGEPSGIWLYQGNNSRYYVTYDEGAVSDTSYYFHNSTKGWRLHKKTYRSSAGDEEWTYGRANYKNGQSKYVIRSHKVTHGDYALTNRYEYHSNDTLKSMVTLKNHMNSEVWRQNIKYLHGLAQYYDQSGKDSLSGYYHYGYMSGVWQHTAGDSTYEVNYPPAGSQIQDTIIDEVLIYDRYETLTCSLPFRNGKIHGLVTVYQDSIKSLSISYQNGKIHGKATLYHDHSTAYQVKYYSEGRLHGTHTKYTHTGALRFEEGYKEGNLHGTTLSYDGDQVQKIKTHHNGHLISVIELDSKGDTTTQLTYHRGLPTGIQSQKYGGYATMVNGAYHGPAELYNSDGKLISSGSYQYGHKYGDWKEYWHLTDEYRNINYGIPKK